MAKAHSWLSDTSDEDDDGSLFSSRTAGDAESMGPANATQPASAARRKFTINLNDSDSEDDLARAHLDFLKKLEQERQAKMGADESEGEEDVKEKEKERKRRGSAADADVLSDEEDEDEDEDQMLDEDEEDEEEERRRKTRPKKMMVRVGVKKKPAAKGGVEGRGQAKATKKRQLKRAEVDEEDEDASMLPSSDEEPQQTKEEDLYPIFFHCLYEGAHEPLVLQEEVLDPATGTVIQPKVQVPMAVNRYLAGYQKEGVKFLYERYKSREGGILGDEPGLGKTVQSVAFILAIMGKQGTVEDRAVWRAKRRERSRLGEPVQGEAVLVVAPANVGDQWKTELTNWGVLEVVNFREAKDKQQAIRSIRIGTVEVLVISYTALVNHWAELQEVEWRACIFDEFHKAKSHKTMTSKSCSKMRARVKVGLTGTPIQNNLEELWSLFHVLAPQRVKTEEEWKAEFSWPIKAMMKRQSSWAVKEHGREKLLKMQALLRPLVLKRPKTIINDKLKGKTEHVVFCPLSDLQYKAYERALALPELRMLKVKNEDCPCRKGKGKPVKRGKCCDRAPYATTGPVFMQRDIHPDAVIWKKQHKKDEECKMCPHCVTLPCLQLLCKIANHPSLLQVDQREHDAAKKAYCTAIANLVFGRKLLKQLPGGLYRAHKFLDKCRTDLCGKLHFLDHLLSKFDMDGDRTLLFSFSVQTLNILQAYITSRGYKWVRLDGKTKGGEREDVIRRFNTDESIQIFLISTKAGGLGLNLTAANRVIIFDVNWNPSHDLQAQDRAFRLGQLRNVEVYRLLSQGTIEELIYMRQIYKQQLSGLAMDGVADEEAEENVLESRRVKGISYDAIEGVKGEEGELFGVGNLLQLDRGSILKKLRANLQLAATNQEGEVEQLQRADVEDLVEAAQALAATKLTEEGEGAAVMEVGEGEAELEDMEVSVDQIFGLLGEREHASTRPRQPSRRPCERGRGWKTTRRAWGGTRRKTRTATRARRTRPQPAGVRRRPAGLRGRGTRQPARSRRRTGRRRRGRSGSRCCLRRSSPSRSPRPPSRRSPSSSSAPPTRGRRRSSPSRRGARHHLRHQHRKEQWRDCQGQPSQPRERVSE